jgi:hypothetical protein
LYNNHLCEVASENLGPWWWRRAQERILWEGGVGCLKAQRWGIQREEQIKDENENEDEDETWQHEKEYHFVTYKS